LVFRLIANWSALPDEQDGSGVGVPSWQKLAAELERERVDRRAPVSRGKAKRLAKPKKGTRKKDR
jgi:hypothetical protein